MRLALFGYAWNPQLQLDAYMAETIDAFTRLGVDVDLYLGGQLSRQFGIYGLNPNLDLARLAEFIAAQGYAGAVSFNNSMLITAVREAVRGRIVSVIVDEPEHWFDHTRVGPFEVLREDIEIVAMSSAVEQRILDGVEGARPRLHFRLPATNVGAGPRPAAPAHPISWVASYVGDLNLDQYLELICERPDFRDLTIRCLAALARDGDLKSFNTAGGPDAALIAALPWTFDFFQSQMQNILTNRARVAVVERLARHGLALFGNAGWRKLMTYNAAVLAALQSGPAPASHADLMRIYNASQIAINVPQSHTAHGAVQYRMIDIMASGALLVTKYNRGSDLYRVFGEDCPVPTYNTLDDLERVCIHYLSHERERREIVERCNALVSAGFGFDDRARDLLTMIRMEPTQGAAPGALRRLDLKAVAGT